MAPLEIRHRSVRPISAKHAQASRFLQQSPRGYDAGKKIKGRKRHALVDTDGRPLLVEPHTADVQDRDGGGALLQISRGLFPFIEKVWADGGYNHHRVTEATRITVEIVSKIAGQSGFVVLLGAGWSSGSSLGSIETAVWPRTWKPPSNPPQPSSTPPPPCSCYAVWLGQREFRNRL
jgi:hypothetical protein